MAWAAQLLSCLLEPGVSLHISGIYSYFGAFYTVKQEVQSSNQFCGLEATGAGGREPQQLCCCPQRTPPLGSES